MADREQRSALERLRDDFEREALSLYHEDRDGSDWQEAHRRVVDALAALPSQPTDEDEMVEIMANAIWPLDNLSSDNARDELRRDVRRGLRAALNPSAPDKESE